MEDVNIEIVDTRQAPRSYSVVVPAYNEELFIGDCLDSLSRQDFAGPVEIIVVDNNSDDDTARIATRHDAVLVHEPSPGVCNARQAGLTKATGTIIVSVDADTIYPRHRLSTIDRHFASADDVVAVAGPPVFRDGPAWGRVLTGWLFWLVTVIERVSGRLSYVSAANLAFRRSAFGAYDTQMTQGGDELDVLRQLRPHGHLVWDADNPVVKVFSPACKHRVRRQPRRDHALLRRRRLRGEQAGAASGDRHLPGHQDSVVCSGPGIEPILTHCRLRGDAGRRPPRVGAMSRRPRERLPAWA